MRGGKRVRSLSLFFPLLICGQSFELKSDADRLENLMVTHRIVYPCAEDGGAGTVAQENVFGNWEMREKREAVTLQCMRPRKRLLWSAIVADPFQRELGLLLPKTPASKMQQMQQHYIHHSLSIQSAHPHAPAGLSETSTGGFITSSPAFVD
eukprot:jgi/Bigna1/77336/fgenesh1_pg.47_\